MPDASIDDILQAAHAKELSPARATMASTRSQLKALTRDQRPKSVDACILELRTDLERLAEQLRAALIGRLFDEFKAKAITREGF